MYTGSKLRFAVAGLGHIAQMAVLPAFKHATEKCELTAFISDSPDKVAELSQKYNVQNYWPYEELDKALASKLFDAIYIALPNDMHMDFALRAAAAGIHVLCEKPMALCEEDCRAMIRAARKNNVKLMIAYRLHFEPTNMQVVELVKSGAIGKPRAFNSTFTMQVRDGNIRTQKEHGGGPLNDIGIYCINAARYLFGEEPLSVMAMTAKSSDPRFEEIEESASVILKFPNECLASFVCSFGSKDVSRYEMVGTEGRIIVEPAYDYAEELEYTIEIGDKIEKHKTPKRDQFAPELLHLADSIIEGTQPRPSGHEGLNDVKILDAIRKSIELGKLIELPTMFCGSKPDAELIEEKPGILRPPTINVQSGSK